MNRCFTKEDVWMANKNRRSCSTSLAVRKMQITTTMKYHPESIRMTKVKKNNDSKCW